MTLKGLRRATGALAVGLVTSAALPTDALAHGLVARADLPIPRWLFGWAAALVLLVSFALLSALWRQPKLESDRWRPISPLLGRLLASRAVQTTCGAVGAALLIVVIWTGFDGTQAVADNFAPTFIYVIFWVGLVAVSVMLGDVFRAFNPWRAIAAAAARFAGFVYRGTPPAPLPYPPRLGRWPAALGILGFGYMELAAGDGAVPRNLAVAALVYSVITLAAMSFFGIDVWLDRGEAFSVYFNLFARISIFERRGAILGVRPPLAGLADLNARLSAGTLALLSVTIGAVSFDGSTEGSLWPSAKTSISTLLSQHGLSATAASRLASTAGLLASVLVVFALYRLGAAGARRYAGGPEGGSSGQQGEPGRVARGPASIELAFVHSLVPIALAYVGAHYLTFLLTQGQAILPLASDPLGRGWNLFGTANRVVDYGIIGVTATWYVQVALVVAGHVAGLTAAHDRALVLYRDTRLAQRSQYWMLAVMVLFTFLALFLLAQSRL
ncbi:MAG: hypothetical protein NVSMB25_24390 [Thermoleophilaceae bacterium]